MKLFKRLFSKKSLELLEGLMPRQLSLLDIGARWGVQWPWDSFNRELLSMVLVEPDPVEAENLQRSINVNETVVLPFALWRDERTLTLNINRSPGTSSIYQSNRPFLDQFPETERYDTIKTVDMSAISIDSLASSRQIPQVDFAKIDVQGAELAILEGGRNFLAENLVGLEVEVEFAELYTGQPLFGEVESFVRKQLGLELWDLRKTYWKYEKGKHTPGPIKGRMIFGDALFFHPLTGMNAWLERMPSNGASEKLIMLVLSALAYGYTDYATVILNTPSIIRYLDSPLHQKLQRVVNSQGSGFRPFRHGNSHLFRVLDGLARAMQPSHAGWASVGRGLGSRRRGPFWI